MAHPETPEARPPRRRRGWLRLLVSLTATVLLLELSVRWLLFGAAGPLEEHAARLRDASSFASKWTDEHWKLDYLWSDPEARREPLHDPVLGWRHARFEAGTYEHSRRGLVGERRPILLYGDSFAACVTSRPECWEGLLARSELASDHILINYGVGGYGLDQTYLLMRATLDLWAELDPIVIVSLLVDADLDRSVLSFRGWPKPRLRVEDGALVESEPVIEGSDAFLAAHPVGITSYAWRWFVHGSGLAPESWAGEAAVIEETRVLNARILEATRDELAARGLDAFVVVFHGMKHLRDEPPDDWREPFLLAELERLGLRWVSSKDRLLADKRRTGRGVNDYFFRTGMERRHYTPLGNQVVFDAFRSGLRGEFDGPR